MNYKKGDIIEISISDLAFGGLGVGKIADFVVFVEGVVPGDRVKARFMKIKRSFAEAKLETLTSPSPSRIAPRCKHFDVCGGCSLQFLSYENQLKWKEKMVADALRQIGGFKDARVEPIIGCKEPWFYRNKMEYNFSPGPNGKSILGFRPAKKYDEIFDLEECFLQSPRSVEIALAVEKWAQELGIPAFHPRTNEGILKHLVVREGKNTGELMLNLITNGRDFPHTDAFTKFMRAKFPQITSLYRTGVTIQKGYRTVIEEFHLAGKKTLTEILRVDDNGGGNNTLQFEILPQAFFQTNTKQAEALYGKILEFAGPVANESVMDFFCGTGTIGIFFAKSGAKVVGVDNNESAIANARENAAKNSLSNIEFHCMDINKLLFASTIFYSLLPSSILITDPPRAGIAQKSLEKILALKIPKWIYVSCNPTTLARDLKIACEHGYKIEKIQPVDMFPQTYHVETICKMIIAS